MTELEQPRPGKAWSGPRRLFDGAGPTPDASAPRAKAAPRTNKKAKMKLPPWPVDPSLLKGMSADEKRHLLELNERCGVAPLGATSRIIWQPNPDEPIKFISPQCAKVFEANRTVIVKAEGGGKKKLNMFQQWLEWDGRRVYDDVRFAPGNDNPRIFNLFSGWDVDARRGDWSLFQEHLRTVVCAGSPELFSWFMTWLAHIFQRPGEKMPVAVVIRGKKGTGKSIVFDYLQMLMSRYLIVNSDGARALSHFNSEIEKALVLLLEEAYWAGDHAKESVFKNMITSKTHRIERKGVEPYQVPSYMRVALISNNIWVVPATDDERRYAFFDCSDHRRGDGAYFEEMSKQMDEGGAAAMLYDLLHYVPENGWNVLRTAPRTAGLQEQIVESLRGVDRFMHDLAASGIYECDGCDDGGIFLSETQPTEVKMTELRAAVRDALSDQFLANRADGVPRITRAVREWFDAAIEKRMINKNNGKWVIFPPLSEVRDHIRRTKRLEFEAPTIN